MTPTAVTADSHIRYSRASKDYEVWVSGELIANAPDYLTAEQARTAYLAARLARAVAK